MSVANDLQAVHEELEEARKELWHKENALIEGRVADEDRYMISLLRLQRRVRALWEEEKRLVDLLDQEEEAWSQSSESPSEASA